MAFAFFVMLLNMGEETCVVRKSSCCHMVILRAEELSRSLGKRLRYEGIINSRTKDHIGPRRCFLSLPRFKRLEGLR